MERDEAAELIKEHGGKVSTSLSKKTSFMVVGLEAGLKKLARADELKVRQLSEDDLLDLIRTKSGMKPTAVDSPKREPKTTPKKETNMTPKKEATIPKKESKTTPRKETNHSSTKGEKQVEKVKQEPLSPVNVVPTQSTRIKQESKPTQSQDIVMERKESMHEKNIASVENQAWVDKYKPTNVKQIIGQQGAASNVAK